MFQGIIFGVVAILGVAAYFIFKGERKKYFHITLKILAVLYLAVAFFRYIMPDAFIWVINGGRYGDGYFLNIDIQQSVLRWGHNLSYTVLVIAVFFNNRLLKNISIYVCLPFAILSTVFFGNFIDYFMMSGGRGVVLPELFRQIYFSLELVLAMLIPVLMVVVDRHYFHVKDKIEWRNFLVSLPFICIILIPPYIPQSFFGYTGISITALTVSNLIWILVTITEISVIYIIFRFSDRHTRLTVCWFLALGLFMHYNTMYLMGLSFERLPFQLCNLGAYFFPIALLIKNRAFFNFTFLANIMGTIIAMVAPDTGGGLASFFNIHFIMEHMQVLTVPSMMMLLRIFPRVDKTALKHLIVGFSMYCLSCWLLGTIINGFVTADQKVNYFYLFDLDKGFDYFPFIRFSENFTYVILGRFEIYPIFQLLIFGGFLFGCVMLYFLVLKLYAILDDHLELRRARIDMQEKITGKVSKSKKEFVD